MRIRLFLWVFAIAGTHNAFTQSAPPGTGDNSNLNAWFAFGLEQKLDPEGKWSSVSYLGIDGQSSLNSYNILERIGIMVLNQELKYRFSPVWIASLAVSYRHQNEFEHQPPFLPEPEPFRREFRLYGRMMRSFPLKWKPSVVIRQEFREFYTPSFHHSTLSESFRTRLKLQCEIALNSSEQLSLQFGAESLFSTDYSCEYKTWSRFSYRETRLSGFLSLKTRSKRVVYSLGCMDDLLESSDGIRAIPYLSFSVLLKNLL